MSQPAPRLQVLLRVRPRAPAVAGLPAAVRAAVRAGKELSPDRIVLVGADQAFLRRWAPSLRAAAAPVLGGSLGAAALDARLPVLAVDEDAFPDEGALADFLARVEGRGAVRLVRRGRALAFYAPDGTTLGAGTAEPSDAHARALCDPRAEVEDGESAAFFDARTPAEADEAAAVLYSRLSKPNDGYLARFDRRLSIAISRLLLPFPITPNQVTAASLALGLLGAWWLAAPSAARQLQGSLLLWFCCLLDGCDGEIARLKHLETPGGGEFDLWADHVAHLATFVALPIGVARLHPGHDWLVPGILLVTGFLASGYAVWRLVLSAPESRRGPLELAVERVASRDYVYLIVALAAVGRLDWFVWAAAVGSHLFWLWLWSAARAARVTPSPTT